MAIQVNCPSCKRAGQVPDEYLLRILRCPGCNHQFVAIEPPAIEPAAPAAAPPPLPSGPPCPTCNKPLSKYPKRGGTCHHCKEKFYIRKGELLNKVYAEVHDRLYGNPYQWMSLGERIATNKKRTIESLNQWKDIGDLMVGVKIMGMEDPNQCEYCRRANGSCIALEDCTLDKLPPFRECRNELDGCRCMAMPVFK